MPSNYTCPRRTGEKKKLRHDRWLKNRWKKSKDTVWGWSWKPRTCSFCGGIHPIDALRLVIEKWEITGSDKTYKYYLHPPGTAVSIKKLRSNLRMNKKRPFRGVPSIISPTPPVKVYLQHFTDKQIAKLLTGRKK